jgi:hypothetical protein
MQNNDQLDWELIASPGHVWKERLNAVLPPIGLALLIGFFISLGNDITKAVGVNEKVVDTAIAKAAGKDTGRPVLIDGRQLQPLPEGFAAKLAANPKAAVTAADFSQLIEAERQALNATGKLSTDFPTLPLDNIKSSWVNPASGIVDMPMVKLSPDGKTWWIAAVVAAPDQQGTIVPAPALAALHNSGFQSNPWKAYLVQIPGMMMMSRLPAPAQIEKTLNGAQQAAYALTATWPDLKAKE